MSIGAIVAAALVWLGLLFAVALFGERRASGSRLPGAWIYALGLGVHCTSWTFYGTITQAQRSGWWLPPTFVGMIALFVFGWPLLARLVRLAQAHNSTTVADFAAARLGKSSALAAVITGVMLLGTVPYVALQLKAVSTSFDLLAGRGSAVSAFGDSAFWVTLAMAAFAMLFGTRRAAASERHPGLLLAVAFESLLKLFAFLAIGAFVVFGLHDGPLQLAAQVRQELPAAAGGGDGFLTLILLGALATFTLPHQYHVAVTECADPAHVHKARWRFSLYLLLIALPIMPLAWAGALALGDALPSDLYVLGLPLAAGRPDMALLAFLGGLSAATAMVVVATLALSLMLGNHWLTPLLRRSWAQGEGSGDLLGHVLLMRRLGIVAVLMLAWVYSRTLFGSDALADIGAQSFSALGQLAPAVLAALYAPRVPARAVLAGLLGGTVVWAYVLLLPQLLTAAGMQPGWLEHGLLGWRWLAPDSLLGLAALEPISRATALGFLANLVLIAIFSRGGLPAPEPEGGIDVIDLRRLAGRFVDPQTLAQLLPADGRRQADAASIERIEHALAAVIGVSSARLLLRALQRRDAERLETVAELVGETSQALRFNQQLLEAALENMSQGISVVDQDLRLVAWNTRYAQMFGFPSALLRIGMPVADLVAWNARRGLVGAGDPDDHVARRLAHMRAGTRYVAERVFPGGIVVEIRGNPMPGGGFVATFTDVTQFRRAETELKRIAETLEQRVAERSAESERARHEAERANRAKSRFLAAVSHDLAQPLNAARLFSHALGRQLAREPVDSSSARENVANIAAALGSAEDLLSGLLDMSRLDAGAMKAKPRPFPVADLVHSLATEFGVLAQARGLQLRAHGSSLWLHSDPQLLRRVLQNFLGNAVRYTSQGRIVLGCRRRGEALSLEVWDSGPGITEADQATIFEEFRRLDRDGQGLGLGLTIAERFARLLGHAIGLRSWPGRGSVFSIQVPIAEPVAADTAPAARAPVPGSAGARVLVVDNDASVLKAMAAVLRGWNCQVLTARDGEQARAIIQAVPAGKRPDIWLLDYHLDGADTGLAVRSRLIQIDGARPTVIITADHSEAVRNAVQADGCHLLHKPVKPLALKSLLAHLVRTDGDAAADG
ncbi:MAG: hybrid sensor histidine kinase/response regulator [Xanthomonadales bacterium]|nr:hybrid sensor histidine kinase/response regulator [Xanthomonadales bacterium]